MSKINRRMFLQLMGGAAAMSTLQANIAKAQAIPANNATGTIKDVEHIVILMQENRPFDHHFGTLRGVRGFNDPRGEHPPAAPERRRLHPGPGVVAAGRGVQCWRASELRQPGRPVGWCGRCPSVPRESP